MNYDEEEHWHIMEEEQAASPARWCPHERGTGDARWPVLCDKDNRYATRQYCDACKKRREHHV
jgi:hypothetical protein